MGTNCLEIDGPGVERLRHEAGGHRIQRVPPTERRGRVHTSTVTVAVVEGSQQQQPLILEGDLRVEWYSGSGKGGQHRNKHQNSCRLTHIPTGVVRKAETRQRVTSYREALAELTRAVQTQAQEGQHQAANTLRQSQVGSGMRGDKRRTYRFQEDLVKDHVTNKKASCSRVLAGEFDLLWP